MTQLVAGVCPSIIKNLCKKITKDIKKLGGKDLKKLADEQIIIEIAVLKKLLFALGDLGAHVTWEDIVLIHDIIRGGEEPMIALSSNTDVRVLRQAVMLIERYMDEQWEINHSNYSVLESGGIDDSDLPF